MISSQRSRTTREKQLEQPQEESRKSDSNRLLRRLKRFYLVKETMRERLLKNKRPLNRAHIFPKKDKES
jgi:hypothetical protein